MDYVLVHQVLAESLRSTRRCHSNMIFRDWVRVRYAERGNGTSTFGSLKNISTVSQIQWWVGKLSPNLDPKFETAWDVLLVPMIFSRKPSLCEGTINKGPIHMPKHCQLGSHHMNIYDHH